MGCHGVISTGSTSHTPHIQSSYSRWSCQPKSVYFHGEQIYHFHFGIPSYEISIS